MTAAGKSSRNRQADRSVDLVDTTVGRLLIERARDHPDRIAIIGERHGAGGQERLSYRALLEEATQVAYALLSLAERGSYIALWAPNVLEWPIIQYGAALAGMVLVALNPALRAEELALRADALAGIGPSPRRHQP